jgi:hypothetical protein
MIPEFEIQRLKIEAEFTITGRFFTCSCVTALITLDLKLSTLDFIRKLAGYKIVYHV